MKYIDPYIHEYDFYVDLEFAPYIDDIINQFNTKLDIKEGFNVLYENQKLTEFIKNKFEKIVFENYYVSKLLTPIKLWAYVQNNQNHSSVLHNHLTTSTLNGVFYLNPPKEGGELQFLLKDKFFDIKPQKNKLYVFPSWLYHRPLPQNDQKERICINIEYKCLQRPIHKESNTIW